MQLQLPDSVSWLLARLNAAGYAAYVVGGCVRDALLSRQPKDWDVCTSALPEEMQRVFHGCHVVETGLKHGTLTVVLEHVPYEITTFRVDGAYTDHRHPDGVIFVTDVRADLARRDFTVNAMAYHPAEGLVDAFDGREDLARGIIRCVGDPTERFTEDALRILRALRFAAVYGFKVDAATAAAAHALRGTLSLVAAERVRVELAKLLCGGACGSVLRADRDILAQIMPELAPMFDFDQHTPHHRYDVWEHTVRAVESAPPTEVMRLTMLLHDAGKPASFTMDASGEGHAYGHAAVSRRLAEQALTRLKVDRATFDRVLTLVEHHDIALSCEKKLLRRRLNQFGEEIVRQLIAVQRADQLAKDTVPEAEIIAWADQLSTALDAVLSEAPCFTLRDLAVNGRDMLSLGVSGKQVGVLLQTLLESVMDERLPNDRAALLAAAGEMKTSVRQAN